MAKVYTPKDRIRVDAKIHKVKECPSCLGDGKRRVESKTKVIKNGVDVTSDRCPLCLGIGKVRDGETPIDNIAFVFSPLRAKEKEDAIAGTKIEDGKEIPVNVMTMYRRIIKTSLKAVEGLTLADDTKFVLDRDTNGVTEDSIEALMTFEYNAELYSALNMLMQGIPEALRLPGELGLRTDIEIKGLTGEAAKNFM